jgi:outer membrane protein assembly factor BamB
MGCGEVPSQPEPEIGRDLGGVRELFRVPIPPGVNVKHRAALDSKRIYFDLAEAAGVVAHSRATGQQLWRYERPPGGPSNVVVHQDRVLFVGIYAIALDAASGREVWRFETEGNASLAESAAYGQGFYFGTAREIFALAVEDGALLWRTDVGDDSWEHRSIVRGVSVAGDTVYVNVERYLWPTGYINHAYVFALDRHTGQRLWTFREGEGNTRHFFWGEPRVDGGWLLLGDFDMNVYLALDRMTGDVRWRTPGDPGGYFGPPEAPWVSSDTVYGASADR